MKLLLDACVWGGTVQALADAGHDVVWAGDWQEDPGDEEILARAYREGRVLITLDKDFGELVVMRRRPHGGIVRLVNFRASDQARVCLHALRTHEVDLIEGALVTAEPGRLRVRLAETEQ